MQSSKKVDDLANLPDRGRVGEVPGTREILVPNTPYIVIYTVVGDEVRVATVWHERQSRDIDEG